MKSFSSSPSEVEVSTLLEVSLSDGERRLAVRVGGGGLAFPFTGAANCGIKTEYLAKFQRGNVTGKRLNF